MKSNKTPAIRNHQAGAGEIIKRLKRIANWSHQRAHEVFGDWLTLVEADLTSQTKLAESLGDLSERYDATCFPEFIAATEILKASADLGYNDTVGDIYQQFAYPNPDAGQYFTPWPVAEMMGKIIVGEGENLILERLRKAADKAAEENPALEIMLKAGAFVALTCENIDYFPEKFLPIIMPYYEPLTVCDPCVGSGVLLLGAAAQFPDWAIRLGMVQFFGQDIDPDCIKMVKVNILLYGLNGTYWKHKFAPNALQADDATLNALPAPARDFYRAARDAHRKGNAEQVQQFVDEANRVRQEMVAGMPLFA